jgi:diguanylate cyclase (GGDEF)-like protein
MFIPSFRVSSYVALGIAFVCSLMLAAEFDLVSMLAPSHERHQGVELDELLLLSGLFSNLLAGLAVLNSYLGHRERRGRARVERVANLDALTSMPNRRLFFERLEAAFDRVRYGARCAVILLDLDGFKAVNDSYGHAAGDAILVHVARQITRSLTSTSLAARLGGDEFAIVLEGPNATEERAGELSERLKAGISSPLLYEGAELHVGASIGIAFAGPDLATPGALVDAADAAMYQAKRRTRFRAA